MSLSGCSSPASSGDESLSRSQTFLGAFPAARGSRGFRASPLHAVAQTVKNPPAVQEMETPGSILGVGRSLAGGHGDPLRYSCLENLMGRGAWRATVYRVTKSRTRPSDSHTPFKRLRYRPRPWHLPFSGHPPWFTTRESSAIPAPCRALFSSHFLPAVGLLLSAGGGQPVRRSCLSCFLAPSGVGSGVGETAGSVLSGRKGGWGT